jgi:hypothetical protein
MPFDAGANLIHRVSLPHQQYYPVDGFMEHDLVEILEDGKWHDRNK